VLIPAEDRVGGRRLAVRLSGAAAVLSAIGLVSSVPGYYALHGPPPTRAQIALAGAVVVVAAFSGPQRARVLPRRSDVVALASVALVLALAWTFPRERAGLVRDIALARTYAAAYDGRMAFLRERRSERVGPIVLAPLPESGLLRPAEISAANPRAYENTCLRGATGLAVPVLREPGGRTGRARRDPGATRARRRRRTEAMRWQLMIGARYLRSRRRELFVSLIARIAGIGVAIGVMTLCIVMAVMAGFEEDLRERILGFSPHIVLLSHGGLFEPEPDLLAKVRETPGVVAAAPFVYSQAMATTPGSVGGAIVRGVDPSHIDDVIDVSAHVRDGSAAGLGQPMSVRTLVDGEETTVEAPQAIIGFELAKLLGVKVGDWINLVSPLGSPTALGFVPRVKRFAVGAVFDSGMFEYDSTIVFLALPDAQRFLEMGSKITGIEV